MESIQNGVGVPNLAPSAHSLEGSSATSLGAGIDPPSFEYALATIKAVAGSSFEFPLLKIGMVTL